MTKNRTKTFTKRVVKKSLLLTKKTLVKNKHIKKAGKMVRNVVFSGEAQVNVYHIARYAPTIAEFQKQVLSYDGLKYKPLISIVMPTYNTPITYLKECIESVQLQSYPNWELCIADDASPNQDVVKIIKQYAKKDQRIKLVERKKNGHISAATNSAIEIAKGEFISLLDHDDILWPNALFEVVKALTDNPDTDLVYTDEDKIDGVGVTHSYPFFKPDWSPEFLESCNYITHFSTIRKKLVDDIGGLRIGYEGAQDWDLLLRITEKTDKIVHISKVLYSWRIHEASTAMDTDAKPYVYEAQHKLLVDHIARSNEQAIVKQGVIVQHASIEYAVKDTPKISVIVAGGSADVFKKSISKVISRSSTYGNVEFLLTCSTAKHVGIAKKIARTNSSCKLIDTRKLSIAEAYNKAALQAEGAYLVFIEGTMAVASNRWLELLLGDAQRQGIGAVGGKILNQTKDRFLRAAGATGIYALYAPLLEGMPVDDVHYMRGLYGQSRRNVSIVDGYFMIDKNLFDTLKHFDTKLDDMFMADFCLKLISLGQRNVYNPFVQTADLTGKTAGDADMVRDKKAVKAFQERWAQHIAYDPYFNHNFTRTNAQFDIK